MERRLAAVLIADVVGYGQRSQIDEEGTRALFQADIRELFEPRIAAHRGRLIKTMGDGALVEFPSVVEALQCAVEIQEEKATREPGDACKAQLQFRIGVNVGDVIVEGDDIHGDGVNIADRVQGLALPGGIALSGPAYDQVKGKLPLAFVSLGEQRVKSLSEPVRIYRVALGPQTPGAATGESARRLGWRMPAAVLAGLLLAALVLATFWQPWSAFETASSKARSLADARPSLVILPFDNMSGDTGQDYIANGLTEDLTTALARVPGLFVISRNTAFAYKGKSVAPAEIATELGVRYLLEGSIRRVGDTMRINAQLIDGATSGHIWADRFDGRWQEVFALQDKVVGSIAGALQLRLVADVVPARAGGTSNPAAYDAYLKAMDIYNRDNTPKEFAEAVKLLQQAVVLDPDFGAAHAQLAWAYWDADTTRAVMMGLSVDEAHAKVHETLEIAARHPSSAYYQLVAELKVREHESDEAVNVLLKAVALDPSNSLNQLSLAHALNFNGKPEEALGYLDAAARVDPNSWVESRLYETALAEFSLGRFESAAQRIETMNFSATDPWPKFYALQVLVAAYGHLGRYEAAATALARLKKAVADGYLGEPSQLLTQDYMVFKNVVDMERLLVGLSRAGVPEMPGFASDGLAPGSRLNGAEIRQVLFGSRMRGRTTFPKSEPIEQTVASDGALVQTIGSRSRNGSVWVQGDFFCKSFPGELASCGAMFRNAYRTPGRDDVYRAVHCWQQYEFSVVK
ncbi:adenylate/guanylate cyclase domain-containing protein [Ensifer sp.]|jgi:TolB-like protein/class 3 adenylate cyclase|uniref:adenylate/guanylate cyclase domain-containing protein n=1 Tax=Ensifer sp. TaxID=1872086 RepID=UPI002E0FF69A|nr:adenylate/guanylate cyclase domain-containing protein [Ensifer sp.]